MKKIFILAALCASLFCFSQSQQLKVIHPGKENSTFIKKGNKVLMTITIPGHQVHKKSPAIYKLSKLELLDSVYVCTKGRITSINDSTIVMKERNSFFSATAREIRIDKINTLRKLSAGNQVFRTVTTVGGGLALGIMLFYSYAAVGGGEGFVEGMFYAAGTGAFLTRFGRTKIGKKKLNKWKIQVVAAP
ncbi:MAG: hypothetical protein H7Y01_09860 [Ferruginibacter sp.]|nr:hypothetical protein [Chitinophagaceae bacterium]